MLRRSYKSAAAVAALVLSHGIAFAQSPSTDTAPAAPEPAQQAGKPETGREECRWSGKRVITLLWRDDINGAREQLRFFDRFGCPDTRLRDAFRCVIRSGEFDPQKPESVAAMVEQCWSDPDSEIESPPLTPPAAPSPAAQ